MLAALERSVVSRHAGRLRDVMTFTCVVLAPLERSVVPRHAGRLWLAAVFKFQIFQALVVTFTEHNTQLEQTVTRDN